LAGFSDRRDLEWTAKQLKDRLGSEVEDTASILGHDNKYDREAGRMELSCLTKINAFIASENLTQLAIHDVPMTKIIFETMTKDNCPKTEKERDDAREIAGQYRQYAGFFGYTAQVVHVDCKNVARIFSKFMSNPGRLHHKAILYAIGYLIGRKAEFMLYVRAENFDGWFRILVFVDADLGGDHTNGRNGSSTMGGTLYVNESHAYSYSKSIKAVCLSTHHSEYYALNEGTQMGIYIARILRSLLIPVHFPIPIVGDNTGALATAMVPQTKNGRHINLREHWVRDCKEGNTDVIFAHVGGGLNPSNLQTKIDKAPTFKRESKWHMRGIHDAAYQAQLSPTAAALTKRTFDWHANMRLQMEKRKAAAAKRSDEEMRSKMRVIEPNAELKVELKTARMTERAEIQAKQLRHNCVMEDATDWGNRKLTRDRAVEAMRTHPMARLGRQFAYKTIADRAIAMALTVAPFPLTGDLDYSPVSSDGNNRDYYEIDSVYRSDESVQGLSPTPSQMAALTAAIANIPQEQ
jgi:hypothetical protein